MGLLRRLFGNAEKNDEILDVLDTAILDKEVFLTRTAVKMCHKNGTGSIEANVFELDGKGYVTHRFFYTLNKRVDTTFSLSSQVSIIKNSIDQEAKIDAAKEIMKSMGMEEGDNFLEKLIRYFETVNLLVGRRIDDYIFQFSVSYSQEIPVTMLGQYKDSIKKSVVNCARENGIGTESINVKDDGIKQQIEIRVRQ